MTHEFILEDNLLANNVHVNLDKVDLIRNNAMNYNQDMLKKNRKSTKDLVDSSPDSIGHKSTSKNSPKYLNIKGQDHMFRTLRTSQQVKRKDHSQENDKDFRASIGISSKSNLRQTFHKEKQIDVRKVTKQNTNSNPPDGLYDRDINNNYSASQSPRGKQLSKVNSKGNIQSNQNMNSVLTIHNNINHNLNNNHNNN